MKVLAERCYSFYFYLTFVKVCLLSNKFQIFGKQSLPATFTVIFCKGYQIPKKMLNAHYEIHINDSRIAWYITAWRN